MSKQPPMGPGTPDDIQQRIEQGRARRLRNRRVKLGSRAIALAAFVGAAVLDADLPASIALSFGVFEQIGVEMFLARGDEYATRLLTRVLAISFLGTVLVLLGAAYVQWDRGQPPAVSTLLYFAAFVTIVSDALFSPVSGRSENATEHP